jgi:hypothetical protein
VSSKRYELYLFQVLPKLDRGAHLHLVEPVTPPQHKDYERQHASAETLIHMAFVHVRLRHTALFLDSF